MGDGGVLHAVRGCGAGVGLVGLGASRARPSLGRGERLRHPVRPGLRHPGRAGLAHHRLSLEWARLEPEAGEHDPDAVAHYRDVLSTAGDVGIRPWVCLHHFTLPRWFAESGGFLVERNRTEAWARHVEFVAETFGDLVGGWQPVNETNYYARAAYGGGGFPPGRRDRDEVALVEEAIHLATAEAAVRLRRTGAPVASILGLSAIVTQDDAPETCELAAKLYDTYWAPGLGLFRDGVLRVRHRTPVERPDLAGSFDLLGFSYYSAMGVRAGRLPSIPRTLPSRRWATGSGPTASGSSSIVSVASFPGRRCSSPSTASAPPTTARGPPISSGEWRSCTTLSPGASTCAACSTGRPSTTTSGCTATTSPSGSSTATGRSVPAPRSSGVRRGWAPTGADARKSVVRSQMGTRGGLRRWP